MFGHLVKIWGVGWAFQHPLIWQNSDPPPPKKNDSAAKQKQSKENMKERGKDRN